MTARKKITPEEIERQLLADANDADAWEHVATVGATRSPRPAWYGVKTPRASKGGSRTATLAKKK